MGVEPLDADLRKPCQCTGGCNETWQGPEKRFWVTWPDATEPQYGPLRDGVLMEIVLATISAQGCTWVPVTGPGPFITLTILRAGQAPETKTGGGWSVQGSNAALQDYVANDVFTPDNCEGVKGLPTVVDTFTPVINSDVLLTPVRWFENADDVPH